MSKKALAEYTLNSRYALKHPTEPRKETWPEIVQRVFDMHRDRYTNELEKCPALGQLIDEAEEGVREMRVLGAQRALQYAGDPIMKRNERLFNCSGMLIDSPKRFCDAVWLLLAGCGVGFSVQHRHVQSLPDVAPATGPDTTYTIPDTCEGWADAVGVLMATYFVDGPVFKEWHGKRVTFDYSEIRPKGALIADRFLAPGPDPLEAGLEKIRALLEKETQAGKTRLRPLVCYDILMHASDFVISGGVRRSATIAFFDRDDEEMATAKTGNWFNENPQRARSNNSAVLLRSETTREEFDEIFTSIREFGEPGFFFCDHPDETSNPCMEIGFYNRLPDGSSGISFCNLTEINGGMCTSREAFFEACRLSAIIGTLQAGYTNFPYLGKETEWLTREDALLGVSVTGWMDNPDVLFNPEVLREGARVVLETNAEVAEMLGINPAARTTCVKPAGHTSCLLQTASGIHPNHAKHYLRLAQANLQEWAYKIVADTNPLAVEKSRWSANGTDGVIYFPCETQDHALVKKDVSASDLLGYVKLVQENWVIPGTRVERCRWKTNRHNVSNTVTVKDHEWESVRDIIWENRHAYTGVSLLSSHGDISYVQAPFTEVVMYPELKELYGGDVVKAVDRLRLGAPQEFCNAWDLELAVKHPQYVVFPNENVKQQILEIWVPAWRELENRFPGTSQAILLECMKRLHVLDKWIVVKKHWRDVDWAGQPMEDTELKEASEDAAVACTGGQCEI